MGLREGKTGKALWKTEQKQEKEMKVYELEGKKIFTFGGASSHDIDGGILELAVHQRLPDHKVFLNVELSYL